jgi:hypothetical protein
VAPVFFEGPTRWQPPTSAICSNALLLLGAKTISSFDENNDRARLASNLFESVRDSTLRSHPWNCAIKRVALAPDVADAGLRLGLPVHAAQRLHARAVGGRGRRRGEFKIESGKLLCDDNPALLRYVWRNDEPGHVGRHAGARHGAGDGRGDGLRHHAVGQPARQHARRAAARAHEAGPRRGRPGRHARDAGRLAAAGRPLRRRSAGGAERCRASPRPDQLHHRRDHPRLYGRTDIDRYNNAARRALVNATRWCTVARSGAPARTTRPRSYKARSPSSTRRPTCWRSATLPDPAGGVGVELATSYARRLADMLRRWDTMFLFHELRRAAVHGCLGAAPSSTCRMTRWHLPATLTPSGGPVATIYMTEAMLAGARRSTSPRRTGCGHHVRRHSCRTASTAPASSPSRDARLQLPAAGRPGPHDQREGTRS